LGYLSITVPAVVAGLATALERFGALPWAVVADPALALAEDGIPMTAETRRELECWSAKTDDVSRRALFADGQIPEVGARWTQPGIARVLGILAHEGPVALYHGEIARTIVRQVQAHGGILAEDDFSRYRPELVEPIAIDYRGRRVVTAPPPSGGVTSLQ